MFWSDVQVGCLFSCQLFPSLEGVTELKKNVGEWFAARGKLGPTDGAKTQSSLHHRLPISCNCGVLSLIYAHSSREFKQHHVIGGWPCSHRVALHRCHSRCHFPHRRPRPEARVAPDFAPPPTAHFHCCHLRFPHPGFRKLLPSCLPSIAASSREFVPFFRFDICVNFTIEHCLRGTIWVHFSTCCYAYISKTNFHYRSGRYGLNVRHDDLNDRNVVSIKKRRIPRKQHGIMAFSAHRLGPRPRLPSSKCPDGPARRCTDTASTQFGSVLEATAYLPFCWQRSLEPLSSLLRWRRRRCRTPLEVVEFASSIWPLVAASA